MNKSWRRSPQQQKKKVEEDAQAGKHEVHLGGTRLLHVMLSASQDDKATNVFLRSQGYYMLL